MCEAVPYIIKLSLLGLSKIDLGPDVWTLMTVGARAACADLEALALHPDRFMCLLDNCKIDAENLRIIIRWCQKSSRLFVSCRTHTSERGDGGVGFARS